MEKFVYYDLDTGKFVNELEVRKILFDLELGDIYNNSIDYKEGLLNLENQLDIVRSAIYADIKEVVNRLSQDWQIEIKKYNVNDLLSLVS